MSRGRPIVVGKCWACGEPVRYPGVRLKDPTVGVRRLLHPGSCVDRFLVQLGPKVEGPPMP